MLAFLSDRFLKLVPRYHHFSRSLIFFQRYYSFRELKSVINLALYRFLLLQRFGCTRSIRRAKMDAQKAKGDASILKNKHPYTTMKDSHNDATLPPPATYEDKQPQGRRTRRRRVTIISCCCLFLLLLLTFGLIILVHWLIQNPKDGNYNLPDADLNIFLLTHVGAQYELDTDIDLKIAFGNPNKKMGFDIKGINVHTLYAGEEIGQVALPPFHQPRKNDTIVATKIRVAKHVFSEMVGGALQGEVERSNITLQVVMNAKVRNNHNMFVSLHPYRGVHLTCFVNLMAPGVNRTAPGVMISKSCAVR